MSLLSTIQYPSDLRKLTVEQLPEVCRELREMLIQELSGNPGHFASSLGVVELTVGRGPSGIRTQDTDGQT